MRFMTLVKAPTLARPRARSSAAHADAMAALRETVEAIWQTIEQADSERALPLLARRELVRHGTCRLSAVIRRGVESGAFRPTCPSWAIERLPFAIVAGACVHWVFGLSKRPSLQAGTAVAAALEILQPVARSRAPLRTSERSSR